MKRKFFLGTLTLFILATSGFSQSQNFPIWSGIWTEYQTCNTTSQWLFGKNESFAKTRIYGNDGPGGVFNAGTYVIDKENKTITITYSTSINLTNKKVSTSDGKETLRIVKESNTELIFARPLRQGESPNNVSDKKNYYITLTRHITDRSNETAKSDEIGKE